MPELVDLPPELIEHIFVDLASLAVQAASDTDEGTGKNTKITASLFRLTNRYIEQCTRRKFAARYFTRWCIRAPDDASIEKFCAMASIPDLVKCVNELVFYVDNDFLTRAELENTSLQPTIDSPKAEDARNAIDLPGPPAYVRNSYELLDALDACQNVNEFTFVPWQRDQGTVGAASSSQSEDDDRNFDVSSSFAYILSLAEEVGLCPGWLSTATDFTRPRARDCGLKDCTALAEAGDALHYLLDLSLTIYLEVQRVDPDVNSKELGLSLGRQLQGGFANMPMLRRLDLTFEHGDAAIYLWNVLAEAPVLPMLEDLLLVCCTINVHDFTSFVLQHVSTLKLLRTSWIGLKEGNIQALSNFYVELSKAPRLEHFSQYALGFGDYDECLWVELPRHLCSPRHSKEVEDFIEIEIWYWSIRWKGRDEIKRVLAELAVHFGNV